MDNTIKLKLRLSTKDFVSRQRIFRPLNILEESLEVWSRKSFTSEMALPVNSFFVAKQTKLCVARAEPVTPIFIKKY